MLGILAEDRCINQFVVINGSHSQVFYAERDLIQEIKYVLGRDLWYGSQGSATRLLNKLTHH